MNNSLFKSIAVSGILFSFFNPVTAVSKYVGSGNVTPAGTLGQEGPVTIVPLVTSYVEPLPSQVLQMPGLDPMILLLIGVIIIVIAAAGLVYHYLHPKYIPPEEKK